MSTSQKVFICPMCNQAIDLQADRTADENGRVMHASCYMQRVGSTEAAKTRYEDAEWFGLYRDAMLELEYARMNGRLTNTRKAIIARLERLKDMPRFHKEQRCAIEEALSGLKVLEREKADHQHHQQIVERALVNLRPLAPDWCV